MTDPAVTGNVAPSTQDQAKCALLFLYQKVLKRELGFLDAVSAAWPPRMPVVLSRPEVAALMGELPDHKDVKATTIYLRVMNKLGLAVKSPIDVLG